MKIRSSISKIYADQHGATIVEFALILLPMCILLMGSLELGYRIYAQSIVVGSIREAARMASTGEYDGTEVDAFVTQRLHEFRSTANVVIDKRSYSDFAKVAELEPLDSSDSTKWLDINNNGCRDDQGRNGLGNAEEVVYYEVTFSYPTLFPFVVNVLGWPATTNVKANTIVSNEPFAPVVTTTPASRTLPGGPCLPS